MSARIESCKGGGMKRLLPNDSVCQLKLRGPDGRQHPVVGGRVLGHGHQLVVSPVEGDSEEAVLRLENMGPSPVAVEVRSQQEWQTAQVLDQGEETLVKQSMRFYILSKMKESLFEVISVDECPHQEHPTRKRKCEEPSQIRAEEAEGCSLQDGSKQADNNKKDKQGVNTNTGFCLLRVRGLAEKANSGVFGVSLHDLMSGGGGIRTAFVSNYMIDFPWLLSACPHLTNPKQMIVVHGEKGVGAVNIRRSAEAVGYDKLFVHGPPLPIAYGTHHTKAFILEFQTGVRVVVHTANLIYADCNNKTQGVWWQDFPQKPPEAVQEEATEFERDLLEYIQALKLPGQAHEIMESLIRKHNFSSAQVKLVASVPGYHKGNDLHKFGHMGMRQTLQSEKFDPKFNSSPVICQFSSMGSLDEKWLQNEFLGSLGCGESSEGGLLEAPAKGPRGLQIIWPRVSEVQNSIEGWAAGYSIPGYMKNVSKPFLQGYFHRYDGSPVGRQRAMPHIKTFARYSEGALAWVMLTSHNLSKAAWGTLQKNGSQLMIRSYEMGVLFLPSRERAFQTSSNREFTCTPSQQTKFNPLLIPPASLEADIRKEDNGPGPSDCSQGGRMLEGVEFKSIRSDLSETQEKQDGYQTVHFPLPYCLPPEPYGDGDRPWMVDRPEDGVDSLGQTWGVPVSFYGKKQDG